MAISSDAKWGIRYACFQAALVSPISVVVPHGDVPAILGVWLTLLLILAADAGTKLDKDDALKIVTSIASGVGLMMVGIKTATAAVAYTGIGTIPAFIFSLGLNAGVTWVFGNAVVKALNEQDPTVNGNRFARRVVVLIAQFFGVTAPEIV